MAQPPQPPASSSSQEYDVRICTPSQSQCSLMRFSSGVKMNFRDSQPNFIGRQNNQTLFDAATDVGIESESGAGSQFGQRQKIEARRRKLGQQLARYNIEDQPWILSTGKGASRKRYQGTKEGTVGENASYYVFSRSRDGQTFEAFPVGDWYHFTRELSYKHLDMEEAEQVFAKRSSQLDYYALMAQHRLKTEAESSDRAADTSTNKAEEGSAPDSVLPTARSTTDSKLALTAFDTGVGAREDDLELIDDSEGESGSDTSDETQGSKKRRELERKRKDAEKEKKRVSRASKQVQQRRQETDIHKNSDDEAIEDSDEGDFDDREFDYVTSESEEDLETETKVRSMVTNKEDALAAETLRADLEHEERGVDEESGLHDMLGTELNEELTEIAAKDDVQLEAVASETKEESSSGESDLDDMADQSSALFLQQHSTSLKRSATVPAALNGSGSGGKRPRTDPSLLPRGANVDAVLEELLRKILAQGAISTRQIVSRVKSKNFGLSDEMVTQKIATIIRKLNPDKQRVNGNLFLSLKP